MTTTPNPPADKHVVAAGPIPETAIAYARLVIVTEGSFHILTETKRCSIGHTFAPIPEEIKCALVDISGLDWSLDGAVADLMTRHTTEHGGVLSGHVEPLADALVELGGKFYPTVQDYLKPRQENRDA